MSPSRPSTRRWRKTGGSSSWRRGTPTCRRRGRRTSSRWGRWAASCSASGTRAARTRSSSRRMRGSAPSASSNRTGACGPRSTPVEEPTAPGPRGRGPGPDRAGPVLHVPATAPQPAGERGPAGGPGPRRAAPGRHGGRLHGHPLLGQAAPAGDGGPRGAAAGPGRHPGERDRPAPDPAQDQRPRPVAPLEDAEGILPQGAVEGHRGGTGADRPRPGGHLGTPREDPEDGHARGHPLSPCASTPAWAT